MSDEVKNLPFSEKCKMLLEVERKIKGLAEKASEIAGIKRDLEVQETDFRNAIIAEMQADGVLSAEECGLVFDLRNLPIKPIVTDEAKIPDEYFETTRTLDKKKLNAAIKEGKTVPGASLSNGGQTLAIRAKGRNS